MARTSDNTLVPALGVYAQAGAPTFSADLTEVSDDSAGLFAAEVADLASLPTSGNWVGRRIWVDQVNGNRWWDGTAWRGLGIAAGIAAFTGLTQNVAKTMAITFPAGTFTAAPIVVATAQSSTPLVTGCSTDAPTTSGFTLYGQRSDSNPTLNIRWVAVQVTP